MASVDEDNILQVKADQGGDLGLVAVLVLVLVIKKRFRLVVVVVVVEVVGTM